MVTKQQSTSKKSYPKAIQRELNILQYIHSSGQISRIDLARNTGSSLASLTTIAHRLIQRRLIVEVGRGSTPFGRKPVLLAVRDDLGYFVGVDLGTYFLRVVIADINGSIVYKMHRETELFQGRERVLEKTLRAIHEAMEKSGIPKGSIKGIGIGQSAVIDTERGIVVSVPRPGQLLEWKNVPLRALLEKEFGIPCTLQDSVRAIATAERYFGLGRDLKDFIYIDAGMGFGAGIFIDGRLYRGPGGGAGEFGHLTVDDRGPLCCCGNSGCLEAMSSCAAIIQASRDAIQKGVNSQIRELAGGDLDHISIECISEAALKNDSLALHVLHDAVLQIAIALADVVNLLNPHTVIFGGALFRSAPQLLLEPLKSLIKQRAIEKSANEVELKLSPLGSEAGALGAARLIAEKVLVDLYAPAEPNTAASGNSPAQRHTRLSSLL
jgi:predicted NBD/HSP70 family sugar kinase